MTFVFIVFDGEKYVRFLYFYLFEGLLRQAYSNHDDVYYTSVAYVVHFTDLKKSMPLYSTIYVIF